MEEKVREGLYKMQDSGAITSDEVTMLWSKLGLD